MLVEVKKKMLLFYFYAQSIYKTSTEFCNILFIQFLKLILRKRFEEI